MYQCIGKRFSGRKLEQCTNTSETPTTNPITHKPTNQYLCPECGNYRVPKRGLTVDLPDLDKPNQEPESEDFSDELEDLDRDDFGDLQEIDL